MVNSQGQAGFRTGGFFMLRSPLLPWDEIEKWSEGLQPPVPGDSDHLERVLRHNRQILRARLWQLVDRPDVREALFVASPDLEKSLGDWGNHLASDKMSKVEHSLVRYLMRMAGRATPFGLLAGGSTGRIADKSRFEIASREKYRRHTRLDMDYIFTLALALAQNPELQSVMTYQANTSIYLTAGQLRYTEARVNDRMRTYHLGACPKTFGTGYLRSHESSFAGDFPDEERGTPS